MLLPEIIHYGHDEPDLKLPVGSCCCLPPQLSSVRSFVRSTANQFSARRVREEFQVDFSAAADAVRRNLLSVDSRSGHAMSASKLIG